MSKVHRLFTDHFTTDHRY